MKKRLFAFLLALMLVLPTAMASAAYYVVNTSWLKAHNLPEAGSSVLDSYRRDWAMTGTKSGDWTHVTFTNGKEAYVQSKYIKSCAAYYAYVTKDGTAMRKGPDGSFGASGTLAKGTKVKVLTHGSSYDYVSSSAGKGYVRNSLLSKKKVASSGNYSAPAESELTDASYTAWIQNPTGRRVNLRKGPGKRYGVITDYEPGTSVTVLKAGETWTYLRIGGNRGYMMSEYLTTTKPAVTNTVKPADGGSSGGGSGFPYTAYVTSPNGKYVNVHRGVGLGYANESRIGNGGRLAPGTAVEVLDWMTTRWCKIRVNGVVGYIMTKYLTW